MAEVKGEVFVFRPLRRQEYRELYDFSQGEDAFQEALCYTAVVHPEGYDFSTHGKAGLAKLLAEHIVASSGLAHPGQLHEMLKHYREQMNSFENQAEVYINQAFKNISFAEMKKWTNEQFMEHLARAEWAMQTLYGMPFEFGARDEGDQEEITPEEPKSMREIGQEMREAGFDPMMVMGKKPKAPFVDFPMIGGTKLLTNEEALDRVREQVQKLSER